MNKLPNKEAAELYLFLKNLKKSNWIVDSRNFNIMNSILSWHYKITGLFALYDQCDSELQLCYMTVDLCNYFKENVVKNHTKYCKKCRKIKDIQDFYGKKYCKLCIKK